MKERWENQANGVAFQRHNHSGYCLCKWNDIVWLYAAFVQQKFNVHTVHIIRPNDAFVAVSIWTITNTFSNHLVCFDFLHAAFYPCVYQKHTSIYKIVWLSLSVSLHFSVAQLKNQNCVAWKNSHIDSIAGNTSSSNHSVGCIRSNCTIKSIFGVDGVWLMSCQCHFGFCVLFYYSVNAIVLQHLFIVIISIFRHDNAFIVHWHYGPSFCCYAINYLIPFDQMTSNFLLCFTIENRQMGNMTRNAFNVLRCATK